MGETAQKLWMIFDVIRTNRGVYLFDEINALAASRGSENDIGEARRILNSFLQLLDENTGPSIVVATTNLPEILDRAILRRFDLVLPYQLPDAEATGKAMRRRLRGFGVEAVNWNDKRIMRKVCRRPMWWPQGRMLQGGQSWKIRARSGRLPSSRPSRAAGRCTA
jgi:SpoVK/Ycf46/Vps4 family AAA+-type ATPase